MSEPRPAPRRLLANLPWYDHPASAAHLDRFWSVVRAALASEFPDLPHALARSDDPAAQWAQPGLVLSQCCGPDLFTAAGVSLEPVARPVFADLDVEPGAYRSMVAGRRSALDAPRVVVNALGSRSGCGALAEWLQERDITPASVVVSGSHGRSIELLRSGAADLAAIDAHSWRWLPTRGLEVLGETRPAPAPPWVRHGACPVGGAALAAALEEAVTVAGGALGIIGTRPAERVRYAALDAPDAMMARLLRDAGS